MATTARNSPGALSLPQGFALSGLVHGAVAAVVMVIVATLPEQPREETLLAVELQTLLAENVEPTPPTPPVPPAQPVQPVQPPPGPQVPPKVETPQPVKLPKPPRTPKPVRVASPVQAPEITAASAAPPLAEAPPPPPSAPTQSDADRALGLYTAQLKRRLANTLALSQEVRRAGLDGVVTVGFAVDDAGRLVAETLRVVKSSGSAVLDRNALAVVVATPMEPPPPTSTKPLRMSVDLIFRL